MIFSLGFPQILTKISKINKKLFKFVEIRVTIRKAYIFSKDLNKNNRSL